MGASPPSLPLLLRRHIADRPDTMTVISAVTYPSHPQHRHRARIGQVSAGVL